MSDHQVHFTISLTTEQKECIERVLKACDSQESTHGQLDLLKLVEMLLDDVHYVARRPGSWEGSNMAQVLISHGYLR